MRKTLALAALAAAFQLVSGTGAEAREYPWCARYDWTTYNCGFVSFAQCMATVHGVGGYCHRNPRFVYQEPRRRHRRAR